MCRNWLGAADNNGNGNTALYPKKKLYRQFKAIFKSLMTYLPWTIYLLLRTISWANYPSLKISDRAIFNLVCATRDDWNMGTGSKMKQLK